ncbi:MAG: helix-turn-helix transcriptional regulator [Alphaproteobacteria bacterium]|nr:helix-turn-helix transcriptional regulator [Alphaproteobacteria bacterium]
MLQNSNISQKAKRGRQPNGEPNQIDIHVGKRLCLRRQILKMSQNDLAKKLGITFQQVQKYEKGINRISSSRLWDFSQVLNVPIGYFFAEIDNNVASKSPRFLQNGQGNNTTNIQEVDVMQQETALQLVKYFYKIANAEARENLLKFLINLSKRS